MFLTVWTIILLQAATVASDTIRQRRQEGAIAPVVPMIPPQTLVDIPGNVATFPPTNSTPCSTKQCPPGHVCILQPPVQPCTPEENNCLPIAQCIAYDDLSPEQMHEQIERFRQQLPQKVAELYKENSGNSQTLTTELLCVSLTLALFVVRT
ncbi:hypothetical protein AAVH_27033 [Aphelenchoides avenae]|nr:hypothetical protein AAVH_27033 [Aphelenchus avenae]